MTGFTDSIVCVLIVVSRNGKHEQINPRDDGSCDDRGQDQQVEAKGVHGPNSQDGDGSGKAAAALAVAEEPGEPYAAAGIGSCFGVSPLAARLFWRPRHSVRVAPGQPTATSPGFLGAAN
jgi:hypothetical protein